MRGYYGSPGEEMHSQIGEEIIFHVLGFSHDGRCGCMRYTYR